MSTLITRQQYMRTPRVEMPRMHRDYYAQFVIDDTRAHIMRHFSVDELRRALERDEHLNSIPLDVWDGITWTPAEGPRFSRRTARGNAGGRFYARLPFNRSLSEPTGEGPATRAFLVCVAKEAARQLVEAENDVVDELLAA